MSGFLDRYVLCSEVVVPTGFNLDLALSVARADLGLFDSQIDPLDQVSKPVAEISYIEEKELPDRVFAMLELVLEGMLKDIPRYLKPLPLFLTVPAGISKGEFVQWQINSKLGKYVSDIHLSHEPGNRFLNQVLKDLTKHDALIAVAVDSPIAEFDHYSKLQQLYSSQTPWGIIPSEGAAGIVVTKKAVIDTLKLKPLCRICTFHMEVNQGDSRSCSRLVRLNSQHMDNFGKIYSDMTNQRYHVEDYGFAIGARSEYFSDPQEVTLIHDLWGFLGNASALTTISLASREMESKEKLSTLFLFDKEDDRAILTLSKII